MVRFVIGAAIVASLFASASAETLPNGATVLPVSVEPPPVYASYLERQAWCDRRLRARTPPLSDSEFAREFNVCVPDPPAYAARAP